MKSLNLIFDAVCSQLSSKGHIGPLLRKELYTFDPTLESADNRIMRLEEDGSLTEIQNSPVLLSIFVVTVLY